MRSGERMSTRWVKTGHGFALAVTLLMLGCVSADDCVCASAGEVTLIIESISTTRDMAFVEAKLSFAPCCGDPFDDMRTYQIRADDGTSTLAVLIPQDAESITLVPGGLAVTLDFPELGTSMNLGRRVVEDIVGLQQGTVIGTLTKEGSKIADIEVDARSR